MQSTTSLDAPTFLAGPTLYLRGIGRDDARLINAWHPAPFPRSTDLAQEQLDESVDKDATGGTYRFIACRREDDAPVGSVEFFSEDQRSCWVEIHADPVRQEASAIRAEIARVFVPWMLHEREMMVVWLLAPSGDTGIADAAAELGMTIAFRHREAVLRDGVREDRLCYEALHPVWVERLGRPAGFIEGEPVSEPRSPAPPRWAGPAPERAFAVSERLYLRPIDQEDAEGMANWSAKETEPFHDTGRHLGSPISMWTWIRSMSESSPPSEIRFAVVAKDGDVVIGSTAIRSIDWVSKAAETVMWFDRPEYRGSGYGAEAKHLLLDYAFERLGMHMVYAYAWEFNERSWKAMQKQGYRLAGRMSWTGFKHAQVIDDLTLDLLASEWRATRRR